MVRAPTAILILFRYVAGYGTQYSKWRELTALIFFFFKDKWKLEKKKKQTRKNPEDKKILKIF